MYYTGIDPFTKEEVYVAKGLHDRKVQRANQASAGDHYHTVANPRKGEPPGERGLPNRGYRPGRKGARLQAKKWNGGGSVWAFTDLPGSFDPSLCRLVFGERVSWQAPWRGPPSTWNAEFGERTFRTAASRHIFSGQRSPVALLLLGS